MTDEEREVVASRVLRLSMAAQAKLWDRINASWAKIKERQVVQKGELCLTQ